MVSYDSWLGTVSYAGAILSLLANSLLWLFYIYIPEVRTFFVKLLFYLSICDWFAALSVFFMGKEHAILCQLQAGFMQFFPTASFLWMTAVAMTMYCTVAKHMQYMWKYEYLFHLVIWPFPIISTSIMFAFTAANDNISLHREAWCWLSNDNLLMNMLLYYIPLCSMLLTITTLYILTIMHLRAKLQTSTLLHNTANLRSHPNQHKSVYDNYNRYRILQRELIIYLICIVVCRIWGVIQSLEITWENDDDHANYKWIHIVYAFFSPFQGFVNTFLFFNSSIRKRIRQSMFCLKWLPFSTKQSTADWQILNDESTSSNNPHDVALSSPPNNHSFHNSNKKGSTNSAKAPLLSPKYQSEKLSWPYPDGPQPVWHSMPTVLDECSEEQGDGYLSHSQGAIGKNSKYTTLESNTKLKDGHLTALTISQNQRLTNYPSNSDGNSSNRYLPDSLDTDIENNPMKQRTTNHSHSSRHSGDGYFAKDKKKKKVIELDDCKFDKNIIEEYNVFITTFNMADFKGSASDLSEWLESQLEKVRIKKDEENQTSTIVGPDLTRNASTFTNASHEATTGSMSMILPDLSISQLSNAARVSSQSPGRALGDLKDRKELSSLMMSPPSQATTPIQITKKNIEITKQVSNLQVSSLQRQLSKSKNEMDEITKQMSDNAPDLDEKEKSEDIDIYVFGAQEFGFDSKSFGLMLKGVVGSNYSMVTHKRLSGIYIGVLVRKKFRELITGLKVKATRTGIGNLYGNKGGVGISFRICRTSFCFVNAHLAASRSKKFLHDRIEDLILIVQGLDLGDKQIDFTHQFHVMYLLGDLNFRLQGDISVDKVIDLIIKGKHLSLLELDELTKLRAPMSIDKRSLCQEDFTNTDNPLFDSICPKMNKSKSDGSLLGSNGKDELVARTNTEPLMSKMDKHDVPDVGDDDVTYDAAMALLRKHPQNNSVGSKHRFTSDSLGSTPVEQSPEITFLNHSVTDDQFSGIRRRQTSGTVVINCSDSNEDYDGMSEGNTFRKRDSSLISNTDSLTFVHTRTDLSIVNSEDPDNDSDSDSNDETDENIAIQDSDANHHRRTSTNLDKIPELAPGYDSDLLSIHSVKMNDENANKTNKKFSFADAIHKTEKKGKKSNKNKKNQRRSEEEVTDLLPMLQQFVEGAITFPPTYKFFKGTDQYTAKRIPAWCDRILWVSPPHPCINIKQEIYTSSSNTPSISDHRPVFSQFHVTYNTCWNPKEKSQWLVYIKNFYLYLYPSVLNMEESRNTTTPRHYRNNSEQSVKQLRDSTQPLTSIVPYMTVHSPMLATCMRTTMGRRVKNKTVGNWNETNQPHHSIESLLCYKFNTKQFVVKCNNWNNLGNGCLWVVIRDDNLLGDVDVIGASAIPLVDTIKLYKQNQGFNDTKNDEKFLHFRRDVTFATCRRGFIEGHMKCESV